MVFCLQSGTSACQRTEYRGTDCSCAITEMSRRTRSSADSARGSVDEMLCIYPGRSSSCLSRSHPEVQQPHKLFLQDEKWKRGIYFPNFSVLDLATASDVRTRLWENYPSRRKQVWKQEEVTTAGRCWSGGDRNLLKNDNTWFLVSVMSERVNWKLCLSMDLDICSRAIMG